MHMYLLIDSRNKTDMYVVALFCCLFQILSSCLSSSLSSLASSLFCLRLVSSLFCLRLVLFLLPLFVLSSLSLSSVSSLSLSLLSVTVFFLSLSLSLLSVSVFFLCLRVLCCVCGVEWCDTIKTSRCVPAPRAPVETHVRWVPAYTETFWTDTRGAWVRDGVVVILVFFIVKTCDF